LMEPGLSVRPLPVAEHPWEVRVQDKDDVSDGLQGDPSTMSSGRRSSGRAHCAGVGSDAS
ncbi:MAG TPA: hypothetical protein VIL58_08085, partial [Thermoplasmata archaeon]